MRRMRYFYAGFIFFSMNGFAFCHRLPRLPHLSAWMVYWDKKNSQPALLQSMSALKEVSIFAYDFDESGHVMAADDHVPIFKKEILLSLGSKPKPRFLYTVVNDQITATVTKLKDADVIHRVLNTPQARSAHIDELLALCANVDGLDIDYEHLNPEDRDAFTQFIRALAIALHKRHQWLSVVVQPRTAETQWNNQSGAGVIDWGAIVRSVDEIKEMAYMFHYETSAPGSIAPLPWLTQLVAYAKTTVPLSKLCIVLHVGGFDWPERGNARPIEFSEALSLAATQHVQLLKDAETGSAHFSYAGPTGLHTVWIEEGAGLLQKMAVLKAQGIRQVGIWRLGTGDPEFWKAIAQIKIS